MKKIKGRIISVILTVLLILGILPGQVMPVYGAGVYNLHKVKDPREYAKQSENGKMAYITNLADSSLDIMNGSFFAADVPEIKRTLVYLDKSQLPEKGKEKSWKNIAKVTFKNAGYTSDGTIFNLEYTLAGLKMTGMTDSEPPENTEMIVMDITDTQGIVSRSGFCVLSGEKGDIGYISKATPYTRAVWNFTITDSDGNPIAGSAGLPSGSDALQEVVNRELLNVPVEKNWTDFSGSRYTWTAVFQLEEMEVKTDPEAPDAPDAVTDYQPVDGKVMTVSKGQTPAPEFTGLPLYRVHDNGTLYRILYSVEEIGYTVKNRYLQTVDMLSII